MPSKNILLTGGTGFLGSYIARTFLSHMDCQIYAIHRETSDFTLLDTMVDKINWIRSDLVDLPDRIPQIDDSWTVVHCAGLVSFNRYHFSRLIETNVNGTAQVVNWCLQANVDHLVYISSTAALGKCKPGQRIDESAIWQQAPLASSYARSKYLSELEVMRGRAEGLTTTIINPSFLIGGSWWDRGPLSMIATLHDGLKYYPNGTNGIVDVRDVANLVYKVVESRIDLPRIICSAANLTHLELAIKLADCLGVDPPKRTLGSWLKGLISFLDPLIALINREGNISAQALYLANEHFEYDNSLSLTIPGFNYRDTETTLRETCDSFLASKNKGRNYGILPIEDFADI